MQVITYIICIGDYGKEIHKKITYYSNFKILKRMPKISNFEIEIKSSDRVLIPNK